ncbi:hypothetical protein PoB_002916600 [Plakobranchus ocellatus]|uniref:Uncharacterized protein n=1 Tax=Plakobranchus ocellatus TaxID=259542 RepID=A0AAV4A384_9GAST|nr:hypothetical protein PoB_002916600 [Plakobranchus ocellatus]
MELSALTVCCEEISCLKTFVDRQTAQTERQNDIRYALVQGFLLTAPVVMDIPFAVAGLAKLGGFDATAWDVILVNPIVTLDVTAVAVGNVTRKP